MFHRMEHPQYPGFFQCVTIGSFSNKWIELSYNTASVSGFYFIPLGFIIVCHTLIYRNIGMAQRAGMDGAQERGGRQRNHQDGSTFFRRLRLNRRPAPSPGPILSGETTSDTGSKLSGQYVQANKMISCFFSLATSLFIFCCKGEKI